MRKEILEKRLNRMNEKRENLKRKAQASENVDEVRSINEQLAELAEMIDETREEIEAIETEAREAVPADAKLVNGKVAESFKMGENKRSENVTETAEYRNAFKAYVQRGENMPAEMRDAVSSNGVPVPLTVMNEVINTVRKRYGNLYNKVRKTNMPGGVEYPIGALQATFKWINESTVSPRQKLDAVGKVSFGYHTAEIRIAQTFLASIVALEAFESKIAEVIAIAYLEAMDYGIVNGNGNGQMTGILNDARVTNVINMTAADLADWKAWRKKFFAKLPLGYRAGEFIFPLSTVETYLETMSDEVGNPIFRQATGLEVNDGDAVNPNGRFFGREISLVEPEILPDFDTASEGDVIGIYWQPQDYAINENFGFTMRRYFDEETNEWVDKAIVVVDGKVLNPTGYYLIKKKS